MATGTLRDDVVHLQNLEREFAPTPVALALLLTEQDMLVLAVWNWRVDVGAPGDVGAARNQTVVEQVAHGLLQAHIDQLDGLGRGVNTYPWPAEVGGSHVYDQSAPSGTLNCGMRLFDGGCFCWFGAQEDGYDTGSHGGEYPSQR